MRINLTKIQEFNTNISLITNSELNKIMRQDNSFIIADAIIVKNFQEIFNELTDKIIVIDEKNYNDDGFGIFKDFNTFDYVCKELIKHNAGKNTHLYGVGGGSTTDLVGFIASIYLRGIEVSFVPTTLMAMADASIGGKNAINIGKIKNALGSIYQPSNIYLNTDFITLLTNDNILDGFAEIIKMGLLFDITLINDSLNYLDNINSDDAQAKLKKIILKTINHKMKIISEDPNDDNNRAFLNFGHTIGHILELDYKISHGNAVAIGMIYETQIAVLLGMVDISIFNEVYRIITKYFNYNIEIFDLIKSANKIFLDKKVIGNKIKMPVITEIGRAKIEEIKLDDIINCIKMNFNLVVK